MRVEDFESSMRYFLKVEDEMFLKLEFTILTDTWQARLVEEQRCGFKECHFYKDTSKKLYGAIFSGVTKCKHIIFHSDRDPNRGILVWNKNFKNYFIYHYDHSLLKSNELFQKLDAHLIGGGMIFKVGGGGKFLKSKMTRKRRSSRLRDAGGVWGGMCPPLRSRSFFENEAIWCTIFHHFKHLTASLLLGVFYHVYFRTGGSKKVEGPCPPSLKSGGTTGPLAPPPVPPPMAHLLKKTSQKIDSHFSLGFP